MNSMQTICIDLGNSLAKIGYFNNQKIQKVDVHQWNELLTDSILYNNISVAKGIVSSVLSKTQNEEFKQRFKQIVFLNEQTKLPITLNYTTPQTLGKDRICNAVGAWSENRNNNSLVIDIGTCLKFDFISKNGVYLGGSISPGIHLRYRSLHDYTANIPLLSSTTSKKFIGTSTKESIVAGVINGMHAEIERFIEIYRQQIDNLTIFVTGGDAKYFDILTKNNIFANQHLTLIGLHEIFLFNGK